MRIGNFNIVPLVAMAIATQKLAVKGRFEMLAEGYIESISSGCVRFSGASPGYFYGSEIAQMIVYSIGVGGVALSFVIWFVFSYKAFFREATLVGGGRLRICLKIG